jgi:hypothetical protein
VQVDPIKPTLTPTGTKRLKLKCDVLVATSAFKFNLRRYNMVLTFATPAGVAATQTGAPYLEWAPPRRVAAIRDGTGALWGQGLTPVLLSAQLERFL